MKTTINTNLEESVYIASVEASKLWEHMNRGNELYLSYVGMIPQSLELEQLIKVGMDVHTSKRTDKRTSRDVINVKFNQKVRNANETLEYLKGKLEDADKNKLIVEWMRCKQQIVSIEQESSQPEWRGKSNTKLRDLLYRKGFTIKYVDYKTGEVESVFYRMYKRSSAKSRVGNCLFIRSELYDAMMDWSNMGIDFTKHKVSVPSLMAYQSLVTSSIEATIQISPDNILLIDDVKSVFTEDVANVRPDDETGLLGSFEESVEIANDLFDGQSLLQQEYFPEGKSMMLLRNHMFKSAAFATDIQLFLRNQAKVRGIDFDVWELEDMYGNKIKAKDVHMITTPNSLKALKFSHTVDNIWNYWKELVKAEGSIWGICKYEQESKFDGVQRMSYQMINSLPGMTMESIDELTSYEQEYVHNLKHDDDFYIKWLEETATNQNSHDMLAAIYSKNSRITQTKLFRDIRKDKIGKYVRKVKSGKVKIEADYAVLLSCPIEMLKASVGAYDVDRDEPTLRGNQVYSKMFGDGEKLACFRNPHTSPSNILLAVNTHNDEIDKYLPNLSENVVVINTVRHNILERLSGADMDSDTMLMTNNKLLTEATERYYDDFCVCINNVHAEDSDYQYTGADMAVIDNVLGESGKNIGQIVNLGQQYLSMYWDELANGASDKRLCKIMDAVNVLTVLSGLAIDLAKKDYVIDFKDELKHIKDTVKLNNKKPKFWKHISKKAKVEVYNCPMDYLQDVVFEDKERGTNSIGLGELLVECDLNKAYRTQRQELLAYVKDMDDKITRVHSQITKDMQDEDKDEKYREIDDVIRDYKAIVSGRKIKLETMVSMLQWIANNDERVKGIGVRLMGAMYETHPEVFLDSFKRKSYGSKVS